MKKSHKYILHEWHTVKLMRLKSASGPRARVFVPNSGTYIVYLIQTHTEIGKIVLCISLTWVHFQHCLACLPEQ